MDQNERRQLDNKLMSMGLAKTDEPELIAQLGYLVQDHKHLGEMLRACEPEKRTEMFEAIRPHLRFEPKSLYEYLMHKEASGIILPVY